MERRQDSRLSFERERGVLVVGARTAVLEATPPVDVVVGTYVELVVAQRAVRPSSRHELRDRELEQLATLLDLPPADLDALIDRELERLLSPADTVPVEGRDKRRTLVFGALAIVAVAAAVVAGVAAEGGADAAPETEPGATVETITLADGSTATRTESAPATPTEDGVDIGTAVEIERNP